MYNEDYYKVVYFLTTFELQTQNVPMFLPLYKPVCYAIWYLVSLGIQERNDFQQ